MSRPEFEPIVWEHSTRDYRLVYIPIHVRLTLECRTKDATGQTTWTHVKTWNVLDRCAQTNQAEIAMNILLTDFMFQNGQKDIKGL